jgi:hypothetical protein
VLVFLALSVAGLAVAAILFLRAGAFERRPELRLTRERELLHRAAEHHRRQAEPPPEPSALPHRGGGEPADRGTPPRS